jgi:transcription antitermination factor NusA-like protein
MAIIDHVIYRFSSGVKDVHLWADRRAVASSIQDSVNMACNQINTESPDSIPYPLKIEWIKEETVESFIKEGEAIIRLKHYTNQDRNIVYSTLAYLKIGMMPRAKNYLDATLRKGCELKVAARVFITRLDTGAFNYFIDNEYYPSLNKDPALKRDIQMLEEMDSAGFFTHVFLTEVKLTGDRLLGTMPTSVIQEELRSFAAFLQIIANKGETEDVPLSFHGLKIKASIVLVAKKEKIHTYGVVPYVDRISRSAREGYESIYVCGWGEEFTNKLLDIKSQIDGKSVIVLRRYDYPVKNRVKGRLLVCQSNSTYFAERRKLQDEVKQAIYEIVPEVKDGSIEIMALSRSRGIGFKVAVRPAVTGETADIINACMGEHGERLAELKSRFLGEFCAIVPWSDNPKEFILRALTPLRERYVRSIELDEENLVADVEITTDEAFTKTLGKNGHNLKLARELTGWSINIKIGSRLMKMATPEEELKEILSSHIAEIKDGQIEILRLARIEGVGSKVIVRWKSEGNRVFAAQRCCGHNHEILDSIRKDLIGEWLHFHEWLDDPKELIINCLYPLKHTDVKAITLDEVNKMATISLHDIIESIPAWRNFYNLQLAEKVLELKLKIL